MNPLSLLVKLAFFIAALWLAVNNLSPVALRFTSQQSVSLPLIAVLLLGVLIGAAACALALAPRLYRLRRRLQQATATESPGTEDAPSRLRAGRTPAFGGDRIVDAARNVGAVGELDPDTRFPR
jgi:uncharacterized integral membrane protein